MTVDYSNLNEKLKNAKISLKEICCKLKISPASMQKIKENRIVGDSVLEKICKFFNCKVNEIVILHTSIDESRKKSLKPRAISLFSGAGGMDLGFKNAGFDIVWANDVFKEAVQTYKKNIGSHIVLGDIRMISSSDMPDNIDVVIGGFPCQGFSINNKNRSMKDQRNFLYKEMLRVIKDKKPKMFVAENVKGLLSMEQGMVFEMIKKDFEKLGYYVEAKILNAAEYGVPQQRERVIIVGNRMRKSVKFPQKTNYVEMTDINEIKKLRLKPAKTCKEAIGWLKDIRTQEKPINKNGKIIYQHIAANNIADKFWGRKYNVNQKEICDYLVYWRNKSGYTTKQIDEYFGYSYTAGHWFRKDNNSGSVPKPDDWWELKKILKFDNKYDKQVTTLIEKPITFDQSLRVTNWDRPSDTITATSPEIHINKMRRLSVRECALIQTFPENFIFCGKTIGKIYKQIGNAVPVKLAEQIAKCIKKEIENDKKRINRNRTVRI